ncbi:MULTISPECIES: hypothetical protein [Streptomyces]|uniref:Uncharacterized protein n=2 Tax=Streptomyces TaxID=1883 RepID=A0A2U9NZN7_STRAS|nr:hypothetical protein [Streptomyces actuosus]AWT42819.1 hypothetical protein DMT42_11120 [Streptomyces actuosus]MBM4820050.1 hypothetical protein [Streptomyces actuosus]
MRRRRPDPEAAGYPPPLDVFDPSDWWVSDLEDYQQVQYARITWAAARRVYVEGGDWTSFLGPPVWLDPDSPRPVQRSSANTSPIPEERGEGHPPRVNRAAAEPRARPIRLR